jgi:DNA-binding GntR family transcriptional regulator
MKFQNNPAGKVISDWVAENIIEWISTGKLFPGQKIDQQQIATELKVSRTPVREAILRLEADGFVEVRPHYGAYIAKITTRDITDFFFVRSMIEVEIIRQATPNIPEEVIMELENQNANVRILAEKGFFTDHFKFDSNFHETMLEFVDNSFLCSIAQSLLSRTMQFQKFIRKHSQNQIIDSTNEHFHMIEAIKQRDPELAAKSMKLHLEKSMERILMYVHYD